MVTVRNTSHRNGFIHGSHFERGELLLVKMQYGRRPNPLFKMNRWCHVFFEAGNEDGMHSFDEFEEKFSCKYAWTGSSPTVHNGARFVKNLTGFYVSKPTFKDWLMQMDEMMKYN